MTGPLERRIAELTERVTVAEDNARHFMAETESAEEGKNAYLYTYDQHRDDHHNGHTCPEESWKVCIRDAGLTRIAELQAERDETRDRAIRYAKALGREMDLAGHIHSDACHEVYVACEAATWLKERQASDG